MAFLSQAGICALSKSPIQLYQPLSIDLTTSNSFKGSVVADYTHSGQNASSLFLLQLVSTCTSNKSR